MKAYLGKYHLVFATLLASIAIPANASENNSIGKLVYSYRGEKLYETSGKKFLLVDTQNRKINISFINKNPYKLGEIDKEGISAGILHYSNLVAKCKSDYYTYDGSKTDYSVIQGETLLWMVRFYNLSKADRLNGKEWNGQIVFSFLSPTREYRIKNSKWQSWKPNPYFDGYMGKMQKVNGKWVYGKSRLYGQNKPINCNELPFQLP